jgi:thiamine-monophosphate kinase
MSPSERDVIAAATAGMAGRLPVGPGDDAAVLDDGTVIAVDALVEGVHFEPGTPLERVARKAIGRPLSDLCAMGARPELLFVAAMIPRGVDALELSSALNARARAWGLTIAGGDTTRAGRGGLALAVTAVGRCDGGPPWTRAGGRPGDRLVVSGALGGAAAGRHLELEPRRDIVEALRSGCVDVHAAIDLSDGLGRNLPLLCAASGTGARVDADLLPVHRDVGPGRDPVSAVLGDGEDYELLLALPPGTGLPPGLRAIGELTLDSTMTLVVAGRPGPWPGGGYEHEF